NNADGKTTTPDQRHVCASPYARGAFWLARESKPGPFISDPISKVNHILQRNIAAIANGTWNFRCHTAKQWVSLPSALTRIHVNGQAHFSGRNCRGGSGEVRNRARGFALAPRPSSTCISTCARHRQRISPTSKARESPPPIC